jgi:hypothetical protein
MGFQNYGMEAGYNDVNGYDPVVLLRYGEFLAAAQVRTDRSFAKLIDQGINWVPPIEVDPQMVTGPLMVCRPVLIWIEFNYRQWKSLKVAPGPTTMKRMQLIGDCRVARGGSPKEIRKDMLDVIEENRFEPAHTVLLESKPDPLPNAYFVRPGWVKYKDINTDKVEIWVHTIGPQLLLITDAYAADWKAYAADANPPQPNYDVLPADYAFRAIPLAAGDHHIIMEYRPRSYVAGRWVTLAALVAWAVGVAATWVSYRRRPGGQLAPIPVFDASPAEAAGVKPQAAPSPDAASEPVDGPNPAKLAARLAALRRRRRKTGDSRSAKGVKGAKSANFFRALPSCRIFSIHGLGNGRFHWATP